MFMVQHYVAKEKLSEGEDFKCSKCKKLVPGCERQTMFWSTPEILVLQLKRFRHTQYRTHKLSGPVEIPEVMLSFYWCV